MAARIKVYVDTSALIAFRDRSDTYHPLFIQLFSDPPRMITTSLVVAEAHAWFLRRYDVTRALELIDLVDQIACLEIISVGKLEMKGGSDYLRRFTDQDLTLADACGLWIMKREGVGLCWSTDRHLALTGVPLVIYQ